jgi:hypothetical protein
MILQKQLIEKTKTVQELSKNKGITVSELPYPPSNNKTEELENMVTMLQKQLIEKTKTIRELNNVKSVPTDLMKQNSELQKMVGLLQKQLVEKTIELKEYKNASEKMTRIPIQMEDSIPVTRRSKSDPEIIVDVNAVYY